MPDLTDAAHQAHALARRGAHAATAVLAVSLHPFRTVRTLVRLAEPIPPPPTDARTEPPTAVPPPPQPPAPTTSTTPARTTPVADEIPDEIPDLPVEPRGPAPHIPPRIADEVERDYGDELPGFRNGDEAPEG